MQLRKQFMKQNHWGLRVMAPLEKKPESSNTMGIDYFYCG